ncbi:MAG: hypothetical protein ACM3ZE_03570, partial [Myxococcales bacterium]
MARLLRGAEEMAQEDRNVGRNPFALPPLLCNQNEGMPQGSYGPGRYAAIALLVLFRWAFTAPY